MPVELQIGDGTDEIAPAAGCHTVYPSMAQGPKHKKDSVGQASYSAEACDRAGHRDPTQTLLEYCDEAL